MAQDGCMSRGQGRPSRPVNWETEVIKCHLCQVAISFPPARAFTIEI